MKMSVKILIGAFLVLAAGAAPSQAQVRDAGSKILGHYDRFDQFERSGPAPRAYLPQANVAQRPADRAYSYAPARPPAVANQATKPPAPTQSVRRYSYEPSVSAPRRSFVPSRGWQSGVRDAGSKIRGEY